MANFIYIAFLQPFFEACLEFNNIIEAEKYVSRVLPENKVTCYVKLGWVYQFIEVFTLLKVLAKQTLTWAAVTCVATMPFILSPQNKEARTDHKILFITLGEYKFVRNWEQRLEFCTANWCHPEKIAGILWHHHWFPRELVWRMFADIPYWCDV